MTKQFLNNSNNLRKSPEKCFFAYQNGQRLPLKRVNVGQIGTENFNFLIIYQPLKVKIQTKEGFLNPEKYLNNFNIT